VVPAYPPSIVKARQRLIPIYLLIVDALDECDNEDHIRIILQLLAEARLLKVRLRVLIRSRPEVPIRYGFCQIPNAEHRDFIFHDIEAVIVVHDISIFLNYELGSIGKERRLGAGWSGDLVIRQLVQKASDVVRGAGRFELRKLSPQITAFLKGSLARNATTVSIR